MLRTPPSLSQKNNPEKKNPIKTTTKNCGLEGLAVLIQLATEFHAV